MTQSTCLENPTHGGGIGIGTSGKAVVYASEHDWMGAKTDGAAPPTFRRDRVDQWHWMDFKRLRRQPMVLFLMLCMLAQTACAQATAPAELTAFIKSREVCDHLRGELPDPEAQEPSEAMVDNINRQCKGTDAALLKLKNTYANNAAVTTVLDQYEMNIEALGLGEGIQRDAMHKAQITAPKKKGS